MRLIEKKCPNCGADLSFDENDKSCKCEYCKRQFEIERDLDDVEKFNLIYDKIHQPIKSMMMIPFIFAAVVILIISIVIFTNIFMDNKNEGFTENDTQDIVEEEEEKEKLITNVDELTDDDFDALSHSSFSILNQSIVGRNDTTYAYQKTGDPRLEKTYVAYKEGSNKVISIYKVMYHNFFNQSDQQTVYVPSVFNNVEKNVSVSLPNGKNPAPEYYLNSDHSTYIYAFGSFDEAYNSIVKPLESEYQISEK